MSARQLALALGVPANRMSEIVDGNRDISAETALLLASRLWSAMTEVGRRRGPKVRVVLAASFGAIHKPLSLRGKCEPITDRVVEHCTPKP